MVHFFIIIIMCIASTTSLQAGDSQATCLLTYQTVSAPFAQPAQQKTSFSLSLFQLSVLSKFRIGSLAAAQATPASTSLSKTLNTSAPSSAQTVEIINPLDALRQSRH